MFTGHAKQKGSVFWSPSAGVGRVALPFAKKSFAPCSHISWQRIVCAKYTRIGWSCIKKVNQTSCKVSSTQNWQEASWSISKLETQCHKTQKPVTEKSVVVFFPESKMLPNVLLVEASYSSFDIIETRSLLTIHVHHSSRKLVPFMLQINQHWSLKLQAIEPTFFIYTTFNLEIKCFFTNPDRWSLAYDATTSANSVSVVFVHNALPFLQLQYNGEGDKNFICKQNYARLL